MEHQQDKIQLLQTPRGKQIFREKFQPKTKEREVNSWETLVGVLSEISEEKWGMGQNKRKEWH